MHQQSSWSVEGQSCHTACCAAYLSAFAESWLWSRDYKFGGFKEIPRQRRRLTCPVSGQATHLVKLSRPACSPMDVIDLVLCAVSTPLICGKAGNELCLKAVCACVCPIVMR